MCASVHYAWSDMDGVQVFLFKTTEFYSCSTTKIFPIGFKHSQMVRRSSITDLPGYRLQNCEHTIFKIIHNYIYAKMATVGNSANKVS